MKDIKSLVSNFNPIAEQQANQTQGMAIDDFAKKIINQVFDQLAIIFPAWRYNWKSDDPSNPDKLINLAKMEWTKAFNENQINTIDQIKMGFTKARRSNTDFLPGPGKFISWCKPSPEDMGYPDVHQALKCCIAYRANERMFFPKEIDTRPLIIDLCKRIDWWMLNSATSQAQIKKSEEHFLSEYMAMISEGYTEPKVTMCPRLETEQDINNNLSDEQKKDKRARGLEAIRKIRREMPNKPNK